MKYLYLFLALSCVNLACADGTAPSMSGSEAPDQDVMPDVEVPTPGQDAMIDMESSVEDEGPDRLDMMVDMMPSSLDEGLDDMRVEDMEGLADLGDVSVEDQGIDLDMESLELDMMLEPDMTIDMDLPPPGLQIRETCDGDECAEGLSCLGWPSGNFCTPTCGYNPPASGQPSAPDCPPGFSLECHVSNNCLPALCADGCDPGYECDETNRCSPYED